MRQDVYRVSQLEAGCTIIEEDNVRCFLFVGREKALLVDTGHGGGALWALVKSLTDKPLTVVNTHADRDHIGANGQFAEIWLHPAEYDRYRQAGGAGTAPDSIGPIIRSLWEQDLLDIGGRSFEVVLIPGHTPGSIALLDAENGLLIGGDTVQDSRIFMFKPGRNMAAYIESLKRLQSMAYAGRFHQIYASHGTVSLPASVIPDLLANAQQIVAGEAQGEAGELFDTLIWEYRMKAATFLCDR